MLNELSIIKAFDKIIKEQTEGYGLREYLEDTLEYGQTAFSYYRETSDLYDRFRADCNAWLDSLVDERGLNPWEIFPEWDIYPDSEINKWIVITSMFEEYCYYML